LCGLQTTLETGQFLPVLAAPVATFRVIQRVGQALIAMMAEMGLAVALIGQPQPERGCRQALV